MTALYQDRAEAGRALGHRLALRQHSGDLKPPLVLFALPRGGVPVAAVAARRLGAPLFLLLVRKIGAPAQPELAIGAVVDAGGRELIVDETMCLRTGASAEHVRAAADAGWREILRRREVYGAAGAAESLAGRTAIVVDDGIATGATMRAALQALRRRAPARLVVAVPVAPPDVVTALGDAADEVICLHEPDPFRAVGLHYEDFHQVTDAEVVAALAAAAR